MFFSVCSGHSVKSDERTEGIEAGIPAGQGQESRSQMMVAASGERATDNDQCVLETH